MLRQWQPASSTGLSAWGGNSNTCAPKLGTSLPSQLHPNETTIAQNTLRSLQPTTCSGKERQSSLCLQRGLRKKEQWENKNHQVTLCKASIFRSKNIMILKDLRQAVIKPPRNIQVGVGQSKSGHKGQNTSQERCPALTASLPLGLAQQLSDHLL